MNGIPLIGETHKEVVYILKELPVRVFLVCSRIVPPSMPDSDEEEEDDVGLTLKELLAEFNDKVKIWRLKIQNRCENSFFLKQHKVLQVCYFF